MRVAILANTANSFVLPMAQGLHRMLRQIGVETRIFEHGLRMLQRSPAQSVKRRVEGLLAYPYLSQLRTFDLVVVVGHLPTALMDSLNVERLRRLVPGKPIVLYDLVFLPTRPWLIPWLKNGNPERGIQPGNHYGLDRYDYYLCVSVVSRCPMPSGPQPCSRIGINLDDGTLYPEPKDRFVALVDFERPRHIKERAVQIQALEETGTEYVVLHGGYTIDEIRRIYRRCSIYFVAHSESFGLPICELQACGAYVLTPYAGWCQSHWIKDDLGAAGPGELSPNFVVYHNDKDRLIAEIQRIKAAYEPAKVVDTFQEVQPQLYYGDTTELERFLHMVERGEIDARSHRTYPDLEALSDLVSRCP